MLSSKSKFNGTFQSDDKQKIRRTGLNTRGEQLIMCVVPPENTGIIDIAVGGDSPVLIDLAVNSVLVAVELASTLVSTPVDVTDVIRVRDSV
jgi:hypothetical protein